MATLYLPPNTSAYYPTMQFPLTVPIPKYSTLHSQRTVRLTTDRSVQGSWQSLNFKVQRLFFWKIYCQHCTVYRRTRLNIRTTNWLLTFLCTCNMFVCAADSSCFFTVTGLWYWVADWYKCCVLQAAVASLQSPDCDTEWLIGINVVCCRQQLLLYSHRTVILSGWLV